MCNSAVVCPACGASVLETSMMSINLPKGGKMVVCKGCPKYRSAQEQADQAWAIYRERLATRYESTMHGRKAAATGRKVDNRTREQREAAAQARRDERQRNSPSKGKSDAAPVGKMGRQGAKKASQKKGGKKSRK